MFSINAGSLPTLSAQRAAAGLQPHGETGGQRLPQSHCSVLFYTNAGHGCGTFGMKHACITIRQEIKSHFPHFP